MATTYHTQLQQLYVAYFNRPADPAGLAFYEGVLEANAANAPAVLAAISADFAGSAEYRAEYNQLTNTGVVTQVYQNLFGRNPDAAGLAFWVNALNNRNTTIDTMVTDIVKGAGTNSDGVTFNNKVTVATAFTNALDTPAEVAGFNTEEGLDAAKALISSIRTTAQATAAIVPATLDASVAAVVKAGTPFTLQSGLSALAAAEADLADFIEENGEDLDNDDDVDADDIALTVDAAQEELAGLIDDEDFATEDNAGVRAAMIAEQVEINADALEAAEEALEEAQDAVEDVDGLGDAVAFATSAADAVEEAEEAELEAQITFNNSVGSFSLRNTDVTITGTIEDGDLEVTNDDGDVLVSFVDGALEVNEDIDATDYTGLTAMVNAGNAYLSAVADTAAATDAALFANLQVELLDVTEGALTGAFTFTLTEDDVEDTDAPTYDEVLDELSALTAAAITARAAADADDEDMDLAAAAVAAETAVEDFRGQISAFIDANETVLVDAVVLAQEGIDGEGGVVGAMAAIEALAEAQADLEIAEALVEELGSLEDAVDAARADFTANDYKLPTMLGVSAFGTAGSDIFVADAMTSTITSFGRSGDDVLYIGEDFTLNTTGDLKKGNDAVLEVFFLQSGNNTVVVFETKTFGSNSADAEVRITLTGVDADDLNFDNGIITI